MPKTGLKYMLKRETRRTVKCTFHNPLVRASQARGEETDQEDTSANDILSQTGPHITITINRPGRHRPHR